MASIITTIQVEVKDSIQTKFNATIHESMQQFTKGKQEEPNVEDPQHSHYEHIHSSHSPWVSPHSWNKVPKVDMHKFDGSNPVEWVSQMEQYFALHNIWDDETKLHVGVLYLEKKQW
jgi:hypothetical protein